MSTAINGDLSVRVSVDTRAMDWSPSPSGSVWRKRVHLVGPPESGQVTSIVRYEPGSTFHAHDHPDGEEILVLAGVFSDEHGDWPAGTYLLNPEGFRHAPFSKDGCNLLVKLRQYPGRDRRHLVVDTNSLAWQAGGDAGIACKPLYRQHGYADQVTLEHWDPRVRERLVAYRDGAELFVIEGEFRDDTGSYGAGCWLRFPAGAEHHPVVNAGCTLYVKRGGLSCLHSSI